MADPLTPDDVEHEDDRDRRERLLEGLLERDRFAGIPPLVAAARRTQARIDAISIDNECEHGRLPGDPSPPCGCFPEEKAA